MVKLKKQKSKMQSATLDISATDSVVRAVLEKFVRRAAFGKEKYGTDLDRTDLQTVDWIVHAQDELMDGIRDLEKLRQTIIAAEAGAAGTVAAALPKVDAGNPN